MRGAWFELTDKKITDIIVNILKEVHNDHSVFKEEYYTIPLTGSTMQFSYQEMVYAFVRIQCFFGVNFEKCDVENYGFNSIEQISTKVSKKLSL